MNVLDRLETTLRVSGGHQLLGSVETHGAKNAALPIMAAALLANSPVTLHRVPSITDVSVMWQLLEALGARLQSEGKGTITIDPSGISTHRAPYTLVRKLAASFDLVGPLLGRFGRVFCRMRFRRCGRRGSFGQSVRAFRLRCFERSRHRIRRQDRLMQRVLDIRERALRA